MKKLIRFFTQKSEIKEEVKKEAGTGVQGGAAVATQFSTLMSAYLHPDNKGEEKGEELKKEEQLIDLSVSYFINRKLLAKNKSVKKLFTERRRSGSIPDLTPTQQATRAQRLLTFLNDPENSTQNPEFFREYEEFQSDLNKELKKYNEIYDLCLMSDRLELKKDKLYIEKKGDSLKYTVIDPTGKKVSGEITKDEFKQIPRGPLSIDKLKPLLPKILAITSKRGHTLSNADIIKKNFLTLLSQHLDSKDAKHGSKFDPVACYYFYTTIRKDARLNALFMRGRALGLLADLTQEHILEIFQTKVTKQIEALGKELSILYTQNDLSRKQKMESYQKLKQRDLLTSVNNYIKSTPENKPAALQKLVDTQMDSQLYPEAKIIQGKVLEILNFGRAVKIIPLLTAAQKLQIEIKKHMIKLKKEMNKRSFSKFWINYNTKAYKYEFLNIMFDYLKDDKSDKYELCLNKSEIKKGKLYIEKSGDSLEYTVMVHTGRLVRGKIKQDELKHTLEEPLDINKLQPLLPAILKIISARGVTLTKKEAYEKKLHGYYYHRIEILDGETEWLYNKGVTLNLIPDFYNRPSVPDYIPPTCDLKDKTKSISTVSSVSTVMNVKKQEEQEEEQKTRYDTQYSNNSSGPGH
jgi:hypothetical protein